MSRCQKWRNVLVGFRFSDVIRCYGHGKRHAQRLEVLFGTTNFVGFNRAELQEIFRALGFLYQIDGLILVLHDRPVRIECANQSFYLEPVCPFHEELDVLTLV